MSFFVPCPFCFLPVCSLLTRIVCCIYTEFWFILYFWCYWPSSEWYMNRSAVWVVVSGLDVINTRPVIMWLLHGDFLECFLALSKQLMLAFLLPVGKYSHGGFKGFLDGFSGETRRWMPIGNGLLSSYRVLPWVCPLCCQRPVVPEAFCSPTVFLRTQQWYLFKRVWNRLVLKENKKNGFPLNLFSFQKVVWIIPLDVFPGRIFVIPWNGQFLPFFTSWTTWLSSMCWPTSSQ